MIAFRAVGTKANQQTKTTVYSPGALVPHTQAINQEPKTIQTHFYSEPLFEWAKQRNVVHKF